MRTLSHSLLPLSLALVLFFCAAPASAQHSGGGGSRGGASMSPSTSMAPNSPAYNSSNRGGPDDREFHTYDIKQPSSGQQPLRNELPACFRWPMSPLVSGAVSVGGMKIAEGAEKEFNKACEAVGKKKAAEAEQHLTKAVKVDPKFAAAWTLLGQTQQDQGKPEDATRSCNQALEGDPSYLPAYLCLADVAARQEDWSQVAKATSEVLDKHPTRAPAAFYFNALASFYLQQWPAAEKSALSALQDSSDEQKPALHFLLAKIYEEKGDRAGEAAQLREYLKLAPNAPDAPVVQHILQQIDAHPGTAPAGAKPQ